MEFDNENEEISVKSFYTVSVIGKGSYAKVLLVKKKDTGKYYAMKVIKKAKILKYKQKNNIKTERDVLVASNHQFLIKMIFCFQTEDKIFFILEYCPGGELFNLLKKKKRFSEIQAQFFIAQIILALDHLHQHDIIYRDLKPENVLITKDGYLKLTDFGLSKMYISKNKAMTICGTPEYLAPEIMQRIGYGKEVDWWTLGCLTYEILVGIPPFHAKSREILFNQIRFSQPQFPKFISENAQLFIQQLLKKNPSNRLGSQGVQQIKEHPWFKTMNWQYLLKKKYEPFFLPKCSGDMGLGNFSHEFTDIPIKNLEKIKGNYQTIKDFHFEQKESPLSSSPDYKIEIDDDQTYSSQQQIQIFYKINAMYIFLLYLFYFIISYGLQYLYYNLLRNFQFFLNQDILYQQMFQKNPQSGYLNNSIFMLRYMMLSRINQIIFPFLLLMFTIHIFNNFFQKLIVLLNLIVLFVLFLMKDLVLNLIFLS